MKDPFGLFGPFILRYRDEVRFALIRRRVCVRLLALLWRGGQSLGHRLNWLVVGVFGLGKSFIGLGHQQQLVVGEFCEEGIDCFRVSICQNLEILCKIFVDHLNTGIIQFVEAFPCLLSVLGIGP